MIDRETGFLLPPSRDAWRLQKRLARFVVEVIDGLGLSTMRKSDRESGSEGKKLYALRNHPPEPVFGIIKSGLGFRQFPRRGVAGSRGEWGLVTMAWNKWPGT